MQSQHLKKDLSFKEKHKRSIAALYIACGLNPEKVNLFIQSEVHGTCRL
jgi:tryptophanyl-tRNA synthetase